MNSLIRNAHARADRVKGNRKKIDDGSLLVSQIRLNKPKFLRAKQEGYFWDIDPKDYESIDYDKDELELEEELEKEEE